MDTRLAERGPEQALNQLGTGTGHIDIPLTMHGEEMARELAPLLSSVPFSHVLTSPRQRAPRSCELNANGRSASVEPDLAEWDYGGDEGMHTIDTRQLNPCWNVFRDGCPGGGALDQVVIRADRLLGRLRTLLVTIALVTHGEFGCVLAARLVGLAGREGGLRVPARRP